MKVYLVTKVVDRGVGHSISLQIFSTKELAEEYVKVCKNLRIHGTYADYDIDEYSLDMED